MITGRRIVISLLLAIAGAGFFYAFTRPTDNQQPALRDPAVKRVTPPPGDRVLRQSEIRIELAAGYTAVLSVDRRRIPEDQTDKVDGAYWYSFTPGEGKEFKELSPGRHGAAAELWDTTVPDATHRNYSWCFEVH